MKKITIILCIILAVLVACDNSGNQDVKTGHSEEGPREEDHGEESSTVSITKEQANFIGLELGEIQQKSLGGTIRVTGRLGLYPQDQARISPFIGGNVKAIYVIEGDRVNKGQVLTLLEHPTYIQMQQELQQLSIQLDYLRQEYERKEKLYKEQVSSGREFQKAKSEYLSTGAAFKGLKSKLRLLGVDIVKVLNGGISSSIPIRSPINGYVNDINISIGDYIDPQIDMFVVTDNSRVHVDIRVYEKDIYKVKEGQTVYFTVANQPGMILEAVINSVGQTFEDDPKSIHVHADIENKQGDLLPGMYVEGRIVENERLTDVVPEDAVVTEGGQSYIFVKIEESDLADNSEMEEGHEELLTFAKVEISTGVRDGGFVEIMLSSALDSPVIAQKGAYTLSSEMVKGELEHEH